MSYLGLEGKTVVVVGVANKRSVAYHVGRLLESEGATVVYSVQTAEHRDAVASLLDGSEVHVCDVRDADQVAAMVRSVGAKYSTVHGLLHSIAYANFEEFSGVFHEVRREDFLEAMDVSCYSLIALSNAFKDLLDERGAVVTISISSTQMAAEGYGYMAPVKAALDSSLAFLAKAFSRFSSVRFNAVRAGLLRTRASAGIPGYVDNYLYAEQLTLRRRALATQEVANVAAFLLSERSSGINAQGVVVDAGMGVNYFDAEVVKAVVGQAWPGTRG
ncbi:MAG: SDR family oxidoreductase [bacterium]|nr:SDR family oxidoreductase [bacterium]